MAKAAQELAAGRTMTEIAREIGVQQRTIKSWSEREDFKAAKKAAMDEIIDELLPEAIGILREELRSKNEWIAQGAVRIILEMNAKAKQESDQNVIVTFQNMLAPGAPETSGEIDETEDEDDPLIVDGFVEDE